MGGVITPKVARGREKNNVVVIALYTSKTCVLVSIVVTRRPEIREKK